MKNYDDHPDNKKLQKGPGENYSPVHSRRGCTDFLFLLLLIASWVAMTGVGLAAVGLIENDHIKKGDPNRLVNGMDYHGNICGITNFATPWGVDVVNLPKAYPMPSGLSVCIESCPAKSDFDQFVCEYEVQDDIDDTFGMASNFTDSESAKKSLYLFYTAQKQCMPLIESSSFLGYCIPKIPIEEIILSDSKGKSTTESNATSSDISSTESNVTSLESNATSLESNVTSSESNATSSESNSTASNITIPNESQSTSSSDFFDQAMSDAYTVRYVIFAFGCGMAMVLGILFLIIIQVPGVLSLLVWSMIIAIDVGLAGAGYYTKGVSARWAAEARPGNEALVLYYASYALYGLAVLWVLIVLFLRKRIVLAISCVREASRAISAMPIITVYPVVQVLGLVAFTVVWGVYMAFLASSGEIEAKCFCPSYFGGNVTTSTTSSAETADGFSCDEGCYLYKEFNYSQNTKYAGLYMMFVWFWTSQFIVAVGQLVVALSISLWYFSRNKKQIGNTTFFKAVFLVSFFHLGTAAFGSLIIAIIKTLRTILTYVEKKAARSKNRVVVVLMKVLQCLLWCVEKCMKFVNKQSYIQTAIFGYSFCKGAKMAFFLILRNALRISAVSIVSQFILFIGKVFITVASTVVGYYYLEVNFGDQLNYLMIPTLLIALMAYASSEMFNEVFGMSISTILQCFIADEEIFDVDERFACGSLASTIDATQKKSSKKTAISP